LAPAWPATSSSLNFFLRVAPTSSFVAFFRPCAGFWKARRDAVEKRFNRDRNGIRFYASQQALDLVRRCLM
jgi:hypothetical protein